MKKLKRAMRAFWREWKRPERDPNFRPLSVLYTVEQAEPQDDGSTRITFQIGEIRLPFVGPNTEGVTFD